VAVPGCCTALAPRWGRLPGFIANVAAVCWSQADQSSVIDPAVKRSAGATGIEYQVAAGWVGAEEPVEETVARSQVVWNAQLPPIDSRVLKDREGIRTGTAATVDDGRG